MRDHVGSAVLCGIVKDAQGLCSDVQGDVKLKLSRNGVIENGTGF